MFFSKLNPPRFLEYDVHELTAYSRRCANQYRVTFRGTTSPHGTVCTICHTLSRIARGARDIEIDAINCVVACSNGKHRTPDRRGFRGTLCHKTWSWRVGQSWVCWYSTARRRSEFCFVVEFCGIPRNPPNTTLSCYVLSHFAQFCRAR